MTPAVSECNERLFERKEHILTWKKIFFTIGCFRRYYCSVHTGLSRRLLELYFRLRLWHVGLSLSLFFHRDLSSPSIRCFLRYYFLSAYRGVSAALDSGDDMSDYPSCYIEVSTVPSSPHDLFVHRGIRRTNEWMNERKKEEKENWHYR